MNKAEYLAALAHELCGLPPEEQRNALQYYEDYFADAGIENEATVIDELGTPAHVAQQILQDFRELTTVPPKDTPLRSRTGFSPAMLLLIVVLSAILWPVALGLIAFLIALLVGVVATAIGLCLGSIALFGVGIATLISSAASGVLLLGLSLLLLSAGILLGIALFRLGLAAIPPLLRKIVKLCKKPFERRRWL